MGNLGKINIGISIDLETFLESKLLIEADSGSGKSWTIRKMAEECSGKVQQIIIDPEGDFITLREKYPFALVSKDGDIPLNLRYAEALAHKILETGISVIIDLYEFKQHEREQFVKLFCEALMNAPKSLRHSCLIYLDEAQLFCPEDKRAISTSAVIDLCTRGRKRGLCAILATLRISILNKSAAAQCKNKMMGSTSLPLDQKRVGDELGLRTKEEIRDLRNLNKGEFYAFGPAISKEIIKFKVGQVKTTHIKSGSKLLSLPPTPAAIKKILSKLEDIPEEAERELNTKKEMQNEITRLKKELGKKPVSVVQKSMSQAPDSRLIEKLKEENIRFKNSLAQEKKYSDTLYKGMEDSAKQMKKLANILSPITKTLIENLQIQIPKREKPTVINISNTGDGHSYSPANPDHIKQFSERINHNGSIPLVSIQNDSGPMRMLKAAAMFFPGPISKTRMAAIAILSPNSGTFGTYLSKLKTDGFITGSANEFVCTDAGYQEADQNGGIPEMPDSMVDLWLNVIGENSGPGRMLKHLGDIYPDAVTREDLGAATGLVHNSGTFGTYLSSLTGKKLVVKNGKALQLSPELMK